MCKLCAIAARFSRPRQDSLVFDLSQFAVAATASSLTQPLSTQPLQIQQAQRQPEQQIKSSVSVS
ncbi:hypothetical protein H6G00_12250 [Leptolyngbya sp. FACHB-541]|uniref:hypothetical protein n=1 Tax=Leptolyngbya sp. FACHB-541 TaxID=2692810 RepID=UPI0016879099|nr:hypothetical protein [Leptolyngbya sp. FACHB-541]MBD1997388.1 hypothetical protein [Leptolyngbya sp. FACHB-541]